MSELKKSFLKRTSWGPRFLKITVNLRKLTRKRKENPRNPNGKIKKTIIKKRGQKLIRITK